MAQNEVETLEAALSFISQYELPTAGNANHGAVNETEALDLTQAFKANAFKKSHSLEIPDHQTFKHSHSLEVPENEAVEPFSMELDAGFQAAEAFLDDFDTEEELFEPMDKPTLHPSLKEPAVTAKAPSTPQTGRQRLSRKDEISELRDTVAELSQQLDKLQTASPGSGNASDRVGAILYQPESLWQKVAARQLVLRHNAEEANAQLRSLMETRVRQTKNLKRMLSRRNDAETLELVGLKRRKQVLTAGPPPKDNTKVFEKLLSGTDELYAGLDKLFMDNGMPKVPCPGRKRQAHRDTVNGAFVVFLDKNKVPFDLEKTAKAVWKLLAGRHRKDGPYIQGAIDWESREDGDTVTNYVSFNCVAGDVSAELQTREVARRYVTKDRTSFICRSVMEPTPTGVYGKTGLKFYETMVVVVKRGESLASGQETSIIESYLCATRHDEGTEVARKFRGQVYVDIAIEGWERTLTVNNQDIENLLFDESIRVG